MFVSKNGKMIKITGITRDNLREITTCRVCVTRTDVRTPVPPTTTTLVPFVLQLEDKQTNED